jgi:hypothetical protein
MIDKNRLLYYAASLTARGLSTGKRYEHKGHSIFKDGDVFTILKGKEQIKEFQSSFDAAWWFTQEMQ